MTGRGIDQILPHPSDPTLHEPFMKSAEGYVELAERAYGKISRPVDYPYVWGDALEILRSEEPDARIINLETSVTKSEEWDEKGINYRMNPQNLDLLRAARIDCCVLANNHVLDWGATGLFETIDSLRSVGIHTAGAGRTLAEATAPAQLETRSGRVLVFSLGSVTSGIPFDWAAGADRPGLNFFESLSPEAVRAVAEKVRAFKRKGDVVVASIHWGGNWGYSVAPAEMRFARWLIDEAGVDLVHGHSSHHPRGIEIYRGKLILYGCGDFIDDYEGISGYENFRSDLVAMYFPELDPSTGQLLGLELVPLRIRNFRLNRTSPEEARWFLSVLNRESRKSGARFALQGAKLALQK